MIQNSVLATPLADCHVHTAFCGHAKGTMEEYVKNAINKGLDAIVFLEHLEEGIEYRHRTWLTQAQFDEYFRQGLTLRHRYADKIYIGLGVECGFNPKAAAKLCARLAERPWDLIGISCHFLRIDGSHLNLFSRSQKAIKKTIDYGTDKLMTEYLDTLTLAVETLPGHVVCHLDGALRHVPGLSLKNSHFAQIDTLLELIKSRQLRLELNSSGYDIRGEQFPATTIVAQAIELGIAFSYGSDAHTPEDVGRYRDRIMNLLPQEHSSSRPRGSAR